MLTATASMRTPGSTSARRASTRGLSALRAMAIATALTVPTTTARRERQRPSSTRPSSASNRFTHGQFTISFA